MIEMINPLLKLAQLAAVVIFVVCCWLIAGYVLDTVLEIQQIEAATPPTNTTVVNNYYCNLSEPLPYDVYVQDYVYNDTTNMVENVTCAKALPKFSFFTPSPTPALWNDTRRESVGLPADGIGNNCCKHCTPTPTPTITEACEFPWWCR